MTYDDDPLAMYTATYHYYRDQHEQPKIVLARVIHANKDIGYGWAILGQLDTFHGKDYGVKDDEGCHTYRGGRRIARERAICAIGNIKRGVQISDGVWRYKRPILHLHAKKVIALTGAQGLLALSCQNTWQELPNNMQP